MAFDATFPANDSPGAARRPKTRTQVFAIIGLVALASISMAPCAAVKPLLGADGSRIHRPDGTVVMTADNAFMWSVNWFAYSLLILAVALSGWLLLRIVGSLWRFFTKGKNIYAI